MRPKRPQGRLFAHPHEFASHQTAVPLHLSCITQLWRNLSGLKCIKMRTAGVGRLRLDFLGWAQRNQRESAAEPESHVRLILKRLSLGLFLIAGCSAILLLSDLRSRRGGTPGASA